jgi:DNA ligase-associated metallophosphoesterase
MKWVRISARSEPAPPPIMLARSDCGALWVELLGEPVCLRPSGALWIESAAMLVAGDLHLEKGSSYAARGQLLPPYDTRATLQKLDVEIAALNPQTVVLLGDSFHDARAVPRLAPEDLQCIGALGRGRELIWAVGNHDDEGLAVFGSALPGVILAEIAVAGLILRHEPRAHLQPGEVSGHLHPCAKIVARGRGLRRRCFLTDGSRLILPAFGAYAGGLNACDSAFVGLFDRPPLAGVLGEGAVHPITHASLCPD